MHVCGMLMVLCVGSFSSTRADLPLVDQLMTDYWDWRISSSPEFASFVGIHDYDDQLDSMTLAEYEHRLAKSHEFLDRVTSILDVNMTLSHADEVNLRILKEEVLTYIDGYPYMGFLLPLSYSEGVHVDFERLVTWMVFETAEDYEKLLGRLDLLPQQLVEVEALMREGVARGVVQHAITMKGVGESLGRFVVETAEESPLWSTFTSFPDGFTEEQIQSLQERARNVITSKVSPAFETLKNYVTQEYVTRPDIAVTSLPDGIQRYDQLLKFHTSTNLGVADIHQLGLDEVTRIEGEMAKVIEELGYDLSVPEFSAMIRNDSNFYLNDADEMMAYFERLSYEVIPPELSKVFVNLPETELQLVARPSPDGTAAFYLTGSYDGSRPGIFYVNTYFYDKQPTYEIMTLSLHEGNPGHHLQGSHSLESSSMPFFRRVMEDRNYYQAPSRFPMNTGFLEGWGLYSESLGFDLGLFGDPYDRYGHYSFEIFRACRLVVDTGIHALGWTRQEAVDFMTQHSALSLKNIENEVDRYITQPGQAVAYKVGQLTISNLRARAAAELGEAFDVRKFHDLVLDSAGPLVLLEEEVNAWIAAGGGK
ncbi:hypothetical protein C7M84_004121 [Penaeus vannamei]|uniref:DUF885 domain-containing protein n=1 Tax=Penaeus vannamei TaxID=6689 RepID=A0A3R7MBE1_PENVA|nr:uncharacterized protein LOC113804631 [Penaeus vannamei]ROT77241.1 hypothetical protein C7M84_004121 [Penaeus vannamei]